MKKSLQIYLKNTRELVFRTRNLTSNLKTTITFKKKKIDLLFPRFHPCVYDIS